MSRWLFKLGRALRFIILRNLLYPLLMIVFTPRYYNHQLLNRYRGGALLIANHQSNIDPFLINLMLRRQVRYLVSDSNMRTAISRIIFSLFGSIPKSKALPDYAAIKRAHATVRNGDIVGIFPEGQATWNGATTSPLAETAKLIKLLRVPLFMAEIHGSYFVMPRWGRGLRRGPISIRYHQIYNQEEIAQRSPKEIAIRLTELFQYNEYDVQRQQPQYYGGRRRAEYCETFLFLCPRCQQAQSLFSQRNSIYCNKCGQLAILDKQGWCRPTDTLPFETLYEWDCWQREVWSTRLQAATHDRPLLTDRVMVATGYRNRALKPLTAGRLELYPQMLVLHSYSNHSDGSPAVKQFMIRQIEGTNVQNGEILEFYYEGALYSCRIMQKNRNAYKWNVSIELAQRSPAR